MILDEIEAYKREEARALRDRRAELERAAGRAPAPRGFGRPLAADSRVSLIAEFKRRSPSAGRLAGTADPSEVARVYERAGAAAISVLTDGPSFGGSLRDLVRVREAVRLPVLRKDFVLEPEQLLESRAAGADAVLLIVRLLAGDRLAELLAAAAELGLDALVEVHDRSELGTALAAGARIVGVNARDLSDFRVDRAAADALLRDVPGGVTAVAESGVRGPEDVEAAARAGADAVLVGGWLLEGDPGERARRLTGVARVAEPPAPATEVKICGLRRAEDARAAAEAGATRLGFVFAASPRRATPETARAAAAETGVETVGVFVDAEPVELRRVAKAAGVGTLQLHGSEPPEACAALREDGYRVWKALRPRSRAELAAGVARYRAHVDGLLVEGWSARAAGGTGTSFPEEWWDVLPVGEGAPLRILAGGLRPGTVGRVVRRLRPPLIDVSSGVERAPGEKDPERMRAFVREALGAGAPERW